MQHRFSESTVDPASAQSSLPPVSLPLPLRVWGRVGRHLPIAARLRASRALSARLVSSGTAYRAGGGFSFAIDAEDPFQATMLSGLYDPLIEAVLREFVAPGSVAVDAGAHLGYFSLRLGRLVGPTGAVHAFECDPRLVPRLRRHVAANGLDNVTVNGCGLLDREQETRLFLPAQLGWSSTLEHAWGASAAATVSMLRLDDYLSEHAISPGRLGFFKLDVEGSELRALRGAHETLAATAAPVLVEFIPERMRAMGEDPDSLLALMADHGYAPFSPVHRRGGGVRLIPGTRREVGEDVLFLKRGA